MALRASILALVSTAALVATAAPARADDVAVLAANEVSAEDVARYVVRNVRRAIAIGPTLGGFSTYELDGGELHGGISFGLELTLFRTWMPSPARIRELAQRKAVVVLARMVRERFGGQRPDAATMQSLATQIAAEVRNELIAELRNARGRLFERPRLLVHLEGNYLFGPSDGVVRTGLAIGAGPLSLGPSFSVRFGDDIVAQAGAELAVHVVPGAGARATVFDVFLRADFELHKRSTEDDQAVLGVRVLFDLI